MRVSSKQFVMTDHSCPEPDSENSEQRAVADASESQSITELEIGSKQQEVSQLVTVPSFSAAISVVCHEITAMELQKRPSVIPPRQEQKSGLRNPQILVPTPETRVLTHSTIESRGTDRANTDDRMIHPRIFKLIQKIFNHTFTLDACTNNKGDNPFCSPYCSEEDSLLNRDLKAEFVWLNPRFKRAPDLLEAFCAQKHAYPNRVGVCILLS